MRTKLDEQFININNSLFEMSAFVEQVIANTNKALLEQDVELANKVVESIEQIYDKEKGIESLCLKLILLQQPVAGDLRFVSATLKIIAELTLIGGLVFEISEMVLINADTPYIIDLKYILKMSELTTKMIKESIEAFINKDLIQANSVIASDDKLDNFFEIVKNDLLLLINENINNGDQAIHLIMIAKFFERIGDHATNIAEWVIFSLVGVYKNINQREQL